MDSLIISAMTNRKVWDRLRKNIPGSMLAPDTNSMLSWVELYWGSYPEDVMVSWASFNTMLGLRGGHLTPEELGTMRILIKQVQDVPHSDTESTVRMLAELAYSGEVAAINQRYQDGEEVDLMTELKALGRKYGDTVKTQDSLLQWEQRNVDDILAANDEQGGLKFNFMPVLAERIRGARGGDCIGVAAPVDAGKTSLLSCIAVDWASQMAADPETYGNRPILWLVNESLASRTVPRIYQAATHLTLEGIRERHKVGEFAPLFLKKVGTWDRIRVKDAHSISMAQISSLVEEMKPAALFVDMVANIKGGTADSEHQNLEAKWQFLRELGCEHDMITVGTMQLSAEGYDMLYPPLTAMKQSKIGVQGALDLALFMGRLDPQAKPEYSDIRGISTPKNKMPVSGKQSSSQFETVFKGGTCEFE
ncbi:putative DNA helicase [Erwinia phage Loshitsa2]|uniref:DNA helicase n=2 Tax=Micantvirus TaxID=3424950 RepID=A0AAE9FM64_9CAUD|nr:putative DNA helicase [Erwinia phage Micant]UNA01147.1 putative DNA helicase [Erwinia phage Loshitsa2]